MDDKLKEEILELIRESLSLNINSERDWGKNSIVISLKLNGETITDDYFYRD